MNTRKLLLTAALLVAAACVSMTGCGGPSGQSICDARAQCEGWSEGEVSSCYSNADGDDFLASRSPCGSFLDDLRACQEATGFCTAGRSFETSCNGQKDNWNHCIGK